MSSRQIDVILKKSYRNVAVCQEMREAIERIGGGVLLSFFGYYNEGVNNIQQHELKFRKALCVELVNILLYEEGQKTPQISGVFVKYATVIQQCTNSSLSLSERQRAYFCTVLPLFSNIRQLSPQVLEMNQSNMN